MRPRREARRRPRWTELLRLAWREGGPIERFLVAYTVTCPFLGVAAVAIITVASGVSAREAVWLWFVALGGMVVFPAFQGPIYDSAYSLNFTKVTLSQDWMRPIDREYYTELLRFRLAVGKDGRIKGDLAWALGYCGLYLGNLLAFVSITLVTYSFLGSPVGVISIILEWGTGMVAGVAYSRRTMRRFKAAEAQGFRLVELKRATRRPSSP